MAPSPLRRRLAKCSLWADRRPPDGCEGTGNGAEGHRSDDVGRSGLLALWGSVPEHLVERHQVDRPAAARNGSPIAKVRLGPTSAAAPKGAYILCPLQAR